MSTCLLGANKCFLEDNWFSISGTVNTLLDLSQLKLRVAFATATLAKSIYPALLSTTPKISHSLWKTAALEFTLGRAYDVWNYGSLFDYDFTHFKQETLGGLINLGSMGFESYSNWINAVPKSGSKEALGKAATEVLKNSDEVVNILASAFATQVDQLSKASAVTLKIKEFKAERIGELLDAVKGQLVCSLQGNNLLGSVKEVVQEVLRNRNRLFIDSSGGIPVSNKFFQLLHAELKEKLIIKLGDFFNELANASAVNEIKLSVINSFVNARLAVEEHSLKCINIMRTFTGSDGQLFALSKKANQVLKVQQSQTATSSASSKVASYLTSKASVNKVGEGLNKLEKSIQELYEQKVKTFTSLYERLFFVKRFDEQGGAVAAVDSQVEAELSKFRFWDKLPRVSTIAGHVFRGVFYAISVTNAFDNYFARVYERNEAVALRKVMADSPK